ncbi:succinate--CoA ligase subunit alpha, partial [Candidatus Woesearchaeota archaeon]|nr:succinate--CoA ligase subunit alpha [Candidatus Woesearchaeota archaeon]
LMVYDAAIEAIVNGIKLILIVSENVPIKDCAKILEYSRRYNCRVIGPASIGVLNVGVGKLGSIGCLSEKDMFLKGNVGIISKSGGMCSETSLILTQQGIGQSTVVGIGGEVIVGSNFTDILDLFQNDEGTKAVVIYGEIGGVYEEEVAEMIKKKKFTKPVIGFISGKFAESVSRSVSFGHAGAIIENDIGKLEPKKKVLKEAGVLVADYHHQIPELVKKALKSSNGI